MQGTTTTTTTTAAAGGLLLFILAILLFSSTTAGGDVTNTIDVATQPEEEVEEDTCIAYVDKDGEECRTGDATQTCNNLQGALNYIDTTCKPLLNPVIEIHTGTYSGKGNTGVTIHLNNVNLKMYSAVPSTVTFNGGNTQILTVFFDGHNNTLLIENINFVNGSGETGGAVLLTTMGQSTEGGSVAVESAYVSKGSGTVSIERCYFGGNSAKDGGALGIVGEVTPSITNCNFTSNVATDNGGGVFWWNPYPFVSPSAVFSDNNFTNNSASYGGALSLMFSTVKNNTLPINSSVTPDLSSASTPSNGLLIQSTVFGDNYAKVAGGAIFLQGNETVTQLSSVSLDHNIASTYGGGLYLSGDNSTVLVNSTIFHANNASSGFAIACYAPTSPLSVYGSGLHLLDNQCFSNQFLNLGTFCQGLINMCPLKRLELNCSKCQDDQGYNNCFVENSNIHCFKDTPSSSPACFTCPPPRSPISALILLGMYLITSTIIVLGGIVLSLAIRQQEDGDDNYLNYLRVSPQ